MKKFALSLSVVPLLVFILSGSSFATDMVIVSCEEISYDNIPPMPAGQHNFQIIVMSFSHNENGSLSVKKIVEASCVKVLARLVTNENYTMKGVSSTDNGPAYTLLWKE
jgi:hypothetical protein